MKFACFLVVLIALATGSVSAQNAIVGTGFSSGWGANCNDNTDFEYLSASAGDSYIRTDQANGTGFQYFRFGVQWAGVNEHRTLTPGTNVLLTPGIQYALAPACTSNGAMYINVTDISHNYIFKTRNAGTNPTGDFVIFQVEGDVREVSSVTQSPTVVSSGQAVTVTANLSGTLNTGQSVYLRYTDDSFATSTVVEMTGSLTNPTAEIPSTFNTASADIEYYVFTSGSGLTISASDADLFTINFDTNGGLNYSYSVQSLFALFDDFDRGANSDIVGIPSDGGPASWGELETIASGASILGSSLRLQSNVDDGREAISYDMTTYYPVAYDATTEDMKWAVNMRSNRNNPSGFSTNNYGSAFIIGCNKSDYTDPEAFGYALVIGGSDGTEPEEPLRLVRFADGLTSNTNIIEIASISLSSETIYLSVNVSYVSCSHSWNIIAREEASAGFTNPSTGSFPLSNTGIDSTYTASDLPYMGALWNHQTDGTSFFRVDNIYIPKPDIASDNEYTWTGGTTNFNTPSNWTPYRDCARSRDRLVFDGGTSFITEIPDQSIGQLILRNNATVTFRNQTTGVISRLTLTGGSGQDLLVESGCTLNLDIKNTNNANGMEVEMLPATTGEIFGTFRFANSTSNPGGRPHQLLVEDTDALHVKNGGRVEASQLLLANHPFGDSGNQNTVVFESGSTYLHAFGAHPFGFAQPASKVIFESGSLYHYTATSTPSMSGRSYANFTYDVNTDRSLTGNTDFFVDTLIINQGTLNFELEAIGTIAGDITVASGASLVFNPPSAGSVLIDAPVIQNISGAGSINIGANATLNLANQNRINIQKNITIDGTANVLSNAVVDFEGENGFSGTGATIIQNNSTVYLGSLGGIANAGSTGNIRTTTRTYSTQAAYIYDGTTNQITGTGLPATLSGNGRIEINNPGNTVTLTRAGTTTTPLLTLTDGLFSVGSTNTVAVTASGSVISTLGNFAAGNLAGTVIFDENGNVSATGDLDFWNVDLPAGSGGVDFGTGGMPNIQNELVISAGRFVDTNGPFYADASTLVYNTGTSFEAGSEWYAAIEVDGRGIPHNVQIGRLGVTNSKVFSGPGSGFRYCTGNLTIGHGAGSGYEFDLGGGDLKLAGDFVLNDGGLFIPNSKAVFFLGSSDQLITSYIPGNVVTFDYMVVDKPAGTVKLNDTPGVTVNVLGSGGNVLTLAGDGELDLQGQTFNLGGSGPFLFVTGGDQNVISSTPANFNIVGQKEVIASNSGALIFDNQVTVNISDGMNFGNDLTLINATLQINGGGFANLNAPRYGSTGVLRYNIGGPYERRVEWNGTDGSPGYPNDVIVGGNTILSPGGPNGGENTGADFGARRDVTIESGSAIYMDAGGINMTVPLVVGRDLIIDGDLSASGIINGDIYVAGNWVRSATGNFYPNDRQVLFNGSTPQTITADGGEIFDYLGFENAGAKALLGDITVNRNIDFYAGTGPLSGDGQTIHLLEDWNNAAGEAAFAEANTTVSFDGNALQNVNCDIGSFEGFHNLSVNNTGEGILLNTNANIYGNLELVDGLIDATGSQVDFQIGSSNSGASQNSYINGFASKTGFTAGEEFLFPVGQFDLPNSIDVFQPAGLVPTTTSPSAVFTVDYIHDNYFPGTFDPNNLPPMQLPLEKVSTCNYWNINRNTVGTDARVRLYWTNECLDISAPTFLEVAKVVGGEWVSQGYNASSTTVPFALGYVESDIVSSFSPFAIGSTGSINVLPIQLLSFTASANGAVVDTRWATSTEINNDYFTVERSLDAEHFEEVGRVAGAGNSTSEMQYAFSDDAPYSGISYYRLKQTDFDGTSTYSQIRAVEIAGDSGFELLKVYRGEDAVNLVYRSELAMLTVEVFDLLGKRIFVDQIRNENGQNRINPSLVRGMYLLRLSNGVEVVSEKFFY